MANRLGPVDVLVNNAGKGGQHGIGRSPFKDSGPAHWDGPMAVDYRGVVHCTRAVLNPMCERGWGRIICIASDAGTTGWGWPRASASRLRRRQGRRGVVHAPYRSGDGRPRGHRQLVALGLMEAPDGSHAGTRGGFHTVGRMGMPATPARCASTWPRRRRRG